jgi:hypothetical protein
MSIILSNTPYDPLKKGKGKFKKATGDSYPAGTLLKGEGDYASGTIFLVDYSGGLRWFKTAEDFDKFGFKYEDVKTVPGSVIESLGFTPGVGMTVNNATSAVTDANPPQLTAPAGSAED